MATLRALPNRTYETLDALAVVGTLILVGMIVAGLFLMEVDPAVAPIIASLGTGLLSIPAMYGSFRWGNTVGAKAATEAAAKVSEKSADALAQIAGATVDAKEPLPVIIEQPADRPVPTTTEATLEDDDDPTPPDEASLVRTVGEV